MTDPFLVVSNIGVEPYVCQFAIVLELANQHVSKVRHLYNLFKVDLQGLFKSDLCLSSHWE
eukprot:9660011-Ditylum_brightwellii.AAC.1